MTTDTPTEDWNPDGETVETLDATADDNSVVATDNTPDNAAGESVVADDGSEDA